MSNACVLQESPPFIGIDHRRTHLANGASLEKGTLDKGLRMGWEFREK